MAVSICWEHFVAVTYNILASDVLQCPPSPSCSGARFCIHSTHIPTKKHAHTCPGAAPSTRPPCRPSRIQAQNVNAAGDIGGGDLHRNPPEPPEYSEIWCEMCRNAAGTSSCAIQYSSRCTTTASRGSAAPSGTFPSRSALHVSHDQQHPASRAAVAPAPAAAAAASAEARLGAQ